MHLLAYGVVFGILALGKVVIEEVQSHVDADHITDIKVAHNGQGERNDE